LRVNKSSFDSQEKENESKTNQIIHLIHYLQCLPVKILSLDGVEADDIIAFLSKELTKDKNNKTYIVSADNDFLQLVDENVIMYRSVEKEYILEHVKESPYELDMETFLKFYHKDGLGHVLKNVDYWIRDNWIIIDRYNKANK